MFISSGYWHLSYHGEVEYSGHLFKYTENISGGYDVEELSEQGTNIDVKQGDIAYASVDRKTVFFNDNLVFSSFGADETVVDISYDGVSHKIAVNTSIITNGIHTNKAYLFDKDFTLENEYEGFQIYVKNGFLLRVQNRQNPKQFFVEKIAEAVVDITDGLVAYYPFDGDANDKSGKEHHGKEFGAINYVNGVSGQAVSFGGNNDYIYISHSSDLNVSGDYSFSFWVYNFTELGVQNVLTKGRDCLNGYFFRLGGKAFAATYGNSWCDHVYQSVLFPINEWHYVTGIISNSDGLIKYFLDGVLMSEGNLPPYTTTNSYPLILGRHFTYPNGGGGYQYPFKGMLDELRIYDRALNKLEIQELYTRSSNP